jgi:predicted ATP-dependent Lon-type protease
LEAIDVLKDKIKSSGGDVEEKEFNKIMLSHGSKEGLDPAKGEKTASRTKVMDKIKTKPGDKSGVKKGEQGRIGQGRFNRQFAMEKEKKMSGMTDKEFSKNRARGGFKSGPSSRGGAPSGRGGPSRGGPPSRGGF